MNEPPAAPAPTMPFGKYRGILITELPCEYLLWLGCLDDLREPLLGDVMHEMGRRIASGECVSGPINPHNTSRGAER